MQITVDTRTAITYPEAHLLGRDGDVSGWSGRKRTAHDLQRAFGPSETSTGIPHCGHLLGFSCVTAREPTPLALAVLDKPASRRLAGRRARVCV